MPWTNGEECCYLCDLCGAIEDVECDDYELPDGWVVKTDNMLDLVMCPKCAADERK